MASLKEIKVRIASVNNTLKITSAMMMISSLKLRRAQLSVTNLTPYHKALKEILTETLDGQEKIDSPYVEKRDVKRIAIVAISSNTALCGSFNVNIERSLKETIEEYKNLGTENIMIFPIGKKISKVSAELGCCMENLNPAIIEKPEYGQSAELASTLMKLYVSGGVDKVEIIYNHFKSTATQKIIREQFLPFNTFESSNKNSSDYIFEPDRVDIIHELIDKVLAFRIYTILVDSNAAEHAARTVAMQLATENAKKLIQELTVQYNKSRQQAITNELLDIMGGIAR